MRRTWFKCYADALVNGTTSKELAPAERWVWVGFLCLATTSPCEGNICIAPGVGFTDEQLAAVLRVPLDILKSAKTKMIQHEKIVVHENNIIEIVNWQRYQSDYQRQKKYRAAPLKKSQPPLSSLSSGSLREEQKRKEKRKIRNLKLHAKVTPKGYNQKLHAKVTKKVTEKVTSPPTPEEIEKEFNDFWDSYPEDRGDRDQAFDEYQKLRATQPVETIEQAFNGYLDYLKHKRINENFDQSPMFASNFLRDGWKRFPGFKYDPPQ